MQWPLSLDPVPARTETFVCVASGPSLTDDQCRAIEDAQCADLIRVVVVNDTYRKLPTADYLFASDEPWWKMHIFSVMSDFKGRRFTVSNVIANEYAIEYVEGVNLRGLNRRPGVINTGGNSGYMAVGLAWQLLAKRIILVGYDFQPTGGRSHWFGDHPRGLSRTHPYKGWVERFRQLAADVRDEGIEMLNCSEATAIDSVPRVTLQKALESL